MKSNLLNIFFILALLSSIISCDGKFVPDPIDPRLPKYSENGYNNAGALVNKALWKATMTCGFPNPCSQTMDIWLDKTNRRLNVIIDGRYYEKKDTSGYYIKFVLNDIYINSLEELDGKKFELDGEKNYGSWMRIEYGIDDEDACNKGKGQIHFRKSGVDMVAGTFGFVSETSNCGKIEVSYGRFDYKCELLIF